MAACADVIVVLNASAEESVCEDCTWHVLEKSRYVQLRAVTTRSIIATHTCIGLHIPVVKVSLDLKQGRDVV